MELSLRAVRHAIALARHRHYGRAAEALSISQPALSRSVAALEAGLGVPLFERGRSGVRLTQFGELLVARGEGLVAGAGELRRELDRMRGLEIGELRVGAGLYPSVISVGTALGRLTAGRPGLRVSLVAEQWQVVADAVQAGTLDVAVVELSTLEKDPRVQVEALRPHAAALVCRRGHPLAQEGATSLQRILGFPMVGPRLPPRAVPFLAPAGTGFRIDDSGSLVPPFHVESVQTAMQILTTGDAVAALPLLLIEAELTAGTLVVLDHHAPWLQTRYGFAWPRQATLSTAALTLMAEVRSLEAQQAERSAGLARTWLSRRPRRRRPGHP
jgi:DNA-binding transcriptional LysR family regulator